MRTLVARDLKFVVVGTLAVAFHGYVRGTKDLDIVPSPDRANTRRLFEALRELDAEPIEVGDFRPEEVRVRFARKRSTRAATGPCGRAPDGSTCSSASPASRATGRYGLAPSSSTFPASAAYSSPVTRISSR